MRAVPDKQDLEGTGPQVSAPLVPRTPVVGTGALGICLKEQQILHLLRQPEGVPAMPTVHVQAGSAADLQEIADSLFKAKKVVVITGAGISTNSGIPVSCL